MMSQSRKSGAMMTGNDAHMMRKSVTDPLVIGLDHVKAGAELNQSIVA